MKHLLFLLLPLGARGQVKSVDTAWWHPKIDTVKCWAITADSTNHLVLSKAWLVRQRQFQYSWPIKYLAPNRRDSLSVIGDFKPIIQEWK